MVTWKQGNKTSSKSALKCKFLLPFMCLLWDHAHLLQKFLGISASIFPFFFANNGYPFSYVTLLCPAIQFLLFHRRKRYDQGMIVQCIILLCFCAAGELVSEDVSGSTLSFYFCFEIIQNFLSLSSIKGLSNVVDCNGQGQKLFWNMNFSPSVPVAVPTRTSQCEYGSEAVPSNATKQVFG